MTNQLPTGAYPLNTLLQEQQKCMVTIKELQSQVQLLQQFKTQVIKAIPDLNEVTSPSTNNNGHDLQAQNPLFDGKEDPAECVEFSSSGNRLYTKSSRIVGLRNSGSSYVTADNYNNVKSSSHSSSSNGTNHLTKIPLRKTERARWGPTVKFVVVAQGKNWLRVRPFAPRANLASAAAANIVGGSTFEDEDTDNYDDGDEDEEEEMHSTSDSLHSVLPTTSASRVKRKSGVNLKTSNLRNGNRGGGSSRTAPHQKDSGFSTDTREQRPLGEGGGESTDSQIQRNLNKDAMDKKNMKKMEDDELMHLLDVIEKQGSFWRNEADRLQEQEKNLSQVPSSPRENSRCVSCDVFSNIGLSAQDLLAEMEIIRVERDQLLDKLTELVALRDKDRMRMEELIGATIRADSAKQRMEEQVFAKTLREVPYSQFINRFSKVTSSMHGLASSQSSNHADMVEGATSESAPAVVGATEDGGGNSGISPNSLPVCLNGGGSSRAVSRSGSTVRQRVRPNPVRVSAILRETRVLELQKQLLVSAFENDVLKSRLQQAKKELCRKTELMEQEKEILHNKIKAKIYDNEHLRQQLQFHSVAERPPSSVPEAARQLSVLSVPVDHITLLPNGDLLSENTPLSQVSVPVSSDSRLGSVALPNEDINGINKLLRQDFHHEMDQNYRTIVKNLTISKLIHSPTQQRWPSVGSMVAQNSSGGINAHVPIEAEAMKSPVLPPKNDTTAFPMPMSRFAKENSPLAMMKDPQRHFANSTKGLAQVKNLFIHNKTENRTCESDVNALGGGATDIFRVPQEIKENAMLHLNNVPIRDHNNDLSSQQQLQHELQMILERITRKDLLKSVD